MRTAVILVTLFVVTFQPLTPTPPTSSLPEDWPHGCEPWGIEIIEPISDMFDYGSACEVYLECDADDESGAICQLTAARELLQSCPLDDLDCTRQALVFTAVIQAIHSGSFGFSEMISRNDVLERIRAGTQAFVNGNFEVALYSYNVTSDRYYNDAFPFVRGLIYEQIGDDEAALASYEEALNIWPANPLVRYTRAHLYARLGRDALAAFDAYWLSELTSDSPQLREMVSPLVEAYLLDIEKFETWIVYPTMKWAVGPAGTFFTDMTGEAGIPVQMRFDEAAAGAFALDLLRATMPHQTVYYGMDAVDAYFLEETLGNFQFRVDILPYPEGKASYSMTLTAPESADDSDLYRGETIATIFEAHDRKRFVLLPLESDDPRLGLREDVCGVVSRISIGMQVENAAYVYAPEFYDQPNAPKPIDTGGNEFHWPLFTITGDSQCIEGDSGPVRWWPAVTENGIEGWIPENEGTEYLFNPVDETEHWLTIE